MAGRPELAESLAWQFTVYEEPVVGYSWIIDDAGSEPEAEALWRARVGDRIGAVGRAACERRRRFTLAIQPAAISLNLALAMKACDPALWPAGHVFWSDTRFDRPDTGPAAAIALLGQVPIPMANLHGDIAIDSDPLAAARRYEQNLRSFFGCAPYVVPRFDLIIVAHDFDDDTSGSAVAGAAAAEIDRLVIATFDHARSRRYITMTTPIFDAADHLFIVRRTAPASCAGSNPLSPIPR